jgi:beta-lactamase regulating signal transducer with metallopeptidase domain
MVDALWVLVLLSKATVVLLGGALAAMALRRAAAGARYLVWLATLASLLLLPALARFAPLRLDILPASPAIEVSGGSGAPAARPQPAAPEAPSARASQPVRAARRAEAADPRLGGDTVARGALLVWGGVAAALLAWLAIGMLAARRIVRGARPLETEAWTSLLCETADRLDLATLPALVASERVEVPFAFGVWRSTIVLPTGAESWPDERRRVVLFHELAHVRRRDLWGHVLGRVACAMYWFHPLAWTASRRLRAESECACDDLVLACGTRASDYAGHLLDILSAARGRGMPAAALPMARRREFEGRVLAILDPGRARRGPGRAQSAALLSAVSVVFVCVSAAAPARPAAPVTRPVALAAVPNLLAAPAVPAPASTPAAAGPRRGDADERAAQSRARENPPATATAQDPSPAAAEQRDRRALLVRVLRTDPDASVRRSAAWALAETTRADEVGVLIAALRGDADQSVREMAAWAMAESRGEDAAAALAEALRRDASAEVRATAAWGLGQRRHADVAALVKATTDDTAEVREAAIWALGQQRMEKAPAELVAALRDGEAKVRLVAAWALGEVLDSATAPALRAAFAKEEDAEVRRALFRALAFLGDHTSELLDKALAAKDPELRSRAVLMLGGGGPGIWPWPWPWPQPRPMP